MVGGDVVVLRTDDDALAARELRQRWGLDVQANSSGLRFEGARGGEFVPELVRNLTPRVAAVTITCPTLDDVFMKLTGRTIRDQESSDVDRLRQFTRAWGGRR